MGIRVAFALCFLSTPLCAQSVVVGNGATEETSPGAQVSVWLSGVEVQSGGKLSLRGSSATGQAAFSGPTAGVPIHVLSGGTIDLKFARLENLTTLTVSPGGKILRIHDTVFADLAGLNPGAVPWIDLSALGASDRQNLPFSFNRVTFADSQGTPTRINVKAAASTPIVRLLGNPATHGNRWGEDYDADPGNRVFFHTGAISRSGGGTFDTLEDAIKDGGTTATSTLTVTLGATAFIDDSIDWNWNTQFSASGPVVLNANLAPMIGAAVSDTDADALALPHGVLVNCVIARGDVSETSADNCTFFDPAGSVSLNYVSGRNVLVQSGFSGAANTFTTSVTAATSSFFADAAGYDFHLVRPAGDSAIDEGTVLSVTTDFEGDPRGIDGKPAGSGIWDIGADEFAGALRIITTSLPADTVNIAYSQTLAATGGTGNLTWSATGLPGWLALNPATGQIIGTPTITGTFSFTVQVADSLGATASQALSMDVNPPPSVSTAVLPDGFVSQAYGEMLAAIGGTGSYTWSAVGTLPAWLSLEPSTGLLSGTPPTDGTFSFAVQVADSVGATATKALSITVTSTLMGGTYAIGPGQTYATPAAAAADLTARGQSGPVVLDIYAGAYLDPLVLGAVPGNSAVNTITFRKAADAGGPVNLGPVQIAGAGYVTLRDFDSITGAAGGKAVSIGGASTNVSLVHNTINAGGDWGVGVYVGPNGGHNNISISGCEIVGTSNAYYGIQIDDNDNPSANTTGLSLINNIVRGFVVRAIDLWSNFGSYSGVAYHNTVWIAAPWNCYAVAQRGQGGLAWRNNIFANYSPAGGSTCFTHTAGTLDANYNDFYRPNGAATGFINGSFHPTLADWRAATGQDADSIQADPLFVSAVDLHITAGSPCVDKGTNVGVAVDFDAAPRPSGTAPDIGADETAPTLPGPTNFAAVGVTSGSITWSWDPVDGATSYVVHAPDESYRGSVDAPATSLTETALPENTRQSRHVHAIAAGPSAPSNTASALTRVHDAGLFDFTALFATGTSVEILVKPPINAFEGSTAVRIERTADNVNWTPVQEFAAGYSPVDGAVSTAHSYLYRIRFRNADGVESGDSPPMPVSLVPTLIAPAAGSATQDRRPAFDWSDAPAKGPVTYVIQIDGNSDFSSPTSAFTPPLDLTEGVHSWRVRAEYDSAVGPWSAASTFSVDTAAPGAPTLLSPADGGLAGVLPVFDWTDVDDPSNVTYRLVVDNNADFSSPELNVAGIEGSTYRAASAPGQAVWYWHVIATDRAGNPGPASAAFRFTIDTTAPPAVTLIAPADEGLVDTVTPTFSWSAVEDSSGVTYRIQIAVDSGFSQPYVDSPGLAATSFTPAAPMSQGAYIWRVIAVDGAGNASTSDTRTFWLSFSMPTIDIDVGRKTNDSTPEIRGRCRQQNARIVVYFNGLLDGYATPDAQGVWKRIPDTAWNDAPYLVTAKAQIWDNDMGPGVWRDVSPLSNAVLVTIDTHCNPPTGVTATPLGAQIRVSWVAGPDADVIGYEVYRRRVDQPAAPYVKIHDKLVAITQFCDSTVETGVAYSYRVKAVDDTIQEVAP